MTTYLHIDGNAFYASCERVFRPDLAHRPVVVCSNNDGCLVTLTKEAKALGLKRGLPLFKVKAVLDANDVAVFSSNYELYGDMSRRMMQTIASLVPAIEPYSIDECFADVTGVVDLTALADRVRAREAMGGDTHLRGDRAHEDPRETRGSFCEKVPGFQRHRQLERPYARAADEGACRHSRRRRVGDRTADDGGP